MAIPEPDVVDRNARIRELAEAGIPQSALALRYGITRQQINNIVNARPAEIGDLNRARAIAGRHLEALRRQKRELKLRLADLERDIATTAAFLGEIDDEAIVRTNDRILGLS